MQWTEIIIIFLFILSLITLLVVFLLLFLIPATKSKIITLFSFSKRKKMVFTNLLAKQICDVLLRLSNDFIGAIITIERRDSLQEYKEIGFEMNAKFSPELIFSVFYDKKSPLHDGAIIISNGHIVSLSSYFPTSKQNIDIKYGARHRAALGISEITDAITFVVSETNGNISVALKGKLTTLANDSAILLKTINDLLSEEV